MQTTKSAELNMRQENNYVFLLCSFFWHWSI